MHLSLRQSSIWRLVACLVLLTLLGRFALPAGFMPSAQGPDGQLVLSLCSGQSLPGWASAKVHDADDDDGGLGTACPFGLLALQTLTPDADLQPVRVAFALIAVVPPAHRALPALPATGPPLGSRAPPSLLV
ncbi:DUF2946 family protein [Verticiella sediminum]|uniref:DUF2946 family protein n=1 Tax=Verticiella sediminum TaxID=1247510 RepID=UPI00117F7163